MSPKKPTILLIPGAWHGPAPYQPFITALETLGFKVISQQLPSVNAANPAETTIATEKDFVLKNLINPELALGNSILIIAHSYGGVIAGAASKGLSPAEVGEGKPAVLGWVYICAIVGFTGTKMIPTKEQLAPWARLHEEEGYCTIPDPQSCVYAGVEDQEAVKKAAEGLGTHSWTSFHSDSPPQAWEDAHWEERRVYVRCWIDRAVPKTVQDTYLEKSGVKWEIEELEDAGHSPFMSHLPQLTGVVERYAKQWS